jgi:hypothetical protein
MESEKAGRKRDHRYNRPTWFLKHYAAAFVDKYYEEFCADFKKQFGREIGLNEREVKKLFSTFSFWIFKWYFRLLKEKRTELMIRNVLYIHWDKFYFLYNNYAIQNARRKQREERERRKGSKP